VVHAVKILFEMEGINAALAKEAFEIAAQKLPIKCKVVSRHGEE